MREYETSREGHVYMKLYLDNCCFNRPYDSQESMRINLETRAKLHIQEEIKKGKYKLVTSYMLEYENYQNTDSMKRDAIKDFQNRHNSFYVPIERRDKLQEQIQEIMSYNISYKDATHLACAIYAGCDYLLTTDIRFQKRYKGTEITIINPLEFIYSIEGEET